MDYKLIEIATIQTGIYRRPALNGDVIYLQAKHFDENGRLKSKEDIQPCIVQDNSIKQHILTENDILFAAKGDKNFACVFQKSLGMAIASSTFFIIKVRKTPGAPVVPEYIAWYLNHPRIHLYLKTQAKGSAVQSVSKKTLEELKIAIPGMETQRKILAFNKLVERERELTKQIVEQKTFLYQFMMLRLTKQS